MRRPNHDYLGMNLDFLTKGEAHVNIFGHVDGMIDSFPSIFDNKTHAQHQQVMIYSMKLIRGKYQRNRKKHFT